VQTLAEGFCCHHCVTKPVAADSVSFSVTEYL
jgi:hypothetical protein